MEQTIARFDCGLSYGDRFFNNKLGVMLAGSYLNTYRGKESQLYYQPEQPIMVSNTEIILRNRLVSGHMPSWIIISMPIIN